MTADPARKVAGWPAPPAGWARRLTRRKPRPSGAEHPPTGDGAVVRPDDAVELVVPEGADTAPPASGRDQAVTSNGADHTGPPAVDPVDAAVERGTGGTWRPVVEAVGPVGGPPASDPADGVDARPPSPNAAGRGEHVPVRTILAAIGIVLAAAAGIELVLALQRVIGMIVIAAFLAVVLSPAVSALVRVGIRRGLATFVVFLVGFAAFGGLGYLFIHPLYSQAVRLSNNLPDILAKAQAGKGSLGKVIAKYHLQKTVAQQTPNIRHTLSHLGGPATSLAKKLVAGLGGLITILVLTFLLLLEGPGLMRSIVSTFPPTQAHRIRRIFADVSKSVTGYVIGNVATSIIAGLVCLIALLIMRVPFAVVFGVWVALVDLLPLVGGLLAGVPTVAFAFLHNPTAGIVLLVVFLVYQQIENHILNPVIMSRTVRLNPLWVILSVLAGAEMASIVGALLAIPAAGAIQVIARDLWDERRGEPKDPPTTGPEETPIN